MAGNVDAKVKHISACGKCGYIATDIHVDVTLKRITQLNLVADLVHPFMTAVFPYVSVLFQQYSAP